MTLLRRMLDDDVRPNRLPDVAWLREYRGKGEPAGTPLLLALGETWDDTPRALLDALRRVPHDVHGYQMSMYGLPSLRRRMKRYVAGSQRLPDDGSWELAVTWTGTRSAMRDFAESVRDRAVGDRPSALAVAPAWDYAGFLEPLGFRTVYAETSADDAFLPSVAGLREAVASVGDLALVVINAQHNPTGHNWSEDVVRTLVEIAVEADAAVLVDDAYFGLCADDHPATSATAVLLRTLGESGTSLPWLSVRSFGKQFHCNGWGIGSVLAEPGFLDDFVNELRPRHTYNYAGHLQWAMAEWLADEAAVETYLAAERSGLATKRAAVVREFALPPGQPGLVAGPAAPYALFPVPESHADDEREYLHACAVRAGVFLSPAWPVARPTRLSGNGYARMYLGPGLTDLTEGVERLRKNQLLPET
ncbi:MAG TPA: pyridoxal phosphate-dependent aminotransferase [Streptomyces sp.]